jgi:alpha/beta superfamily hydrolase
VVGHGYACNKVASYAAQSGDDRIHCNVLTTLARQEVPARYLGQRATERRRMQGDVLVVQGAIDELIEAQPRADEFVAAATGCRVEVVQLAGGNHYFHGKEAELARAIVLWLAPIEKQGDRS